MFKKIDNLGLRYLLIFLIISMVNDLWALKIGFPTLNHLFVGFIVLTFPKIKASKSKPIDITRSLIMMYIVIVGILSSFSFGNFGLQLQFVSVILKLLILVILIPFFEGSTEQNFISFIKSLFISLIVLVFLPALYEYFTSTNIMDYSSGIDKDIFYVRAFTIDKIDFGFNLIVLIATAVVLMVNVRGYKLLGGGIILISLLLLILSFSSTNVLGLGVSGILYLILYSRRKIITAILFIGLVFMGYQITEDFRINYERKFDRQEAGLGKSEFRSVAFIESLNIWLDAPVLGHGTESNGFILEKRISWLHKDISSHNIITEFTNYGLLGGGVLVYLFLYSASYVLQGKSKSKLSFVFWIIITGPLITRLLFYYHRMDKSIYVLWFSIGIMIIFNNQTKKKFCKN